MGTPYYTWTFPVRDFDISPNLLPKDDTAMDQVMEWMNGDDVLSSVSRDDWLTSVLANVLPCFGSKALEFLCKDYPSQPETCDEYEEYWFVSQLDLKDIQAAIEDVDLLISEALSRPEAFVRPLLDYMSEEIADAVRNAGDVRTESKEPEGEDDGDGPAYFFSFLKCLRSLLVAAQTRNFSVLHVRYIYI